MQQFNKEQLTSMSLDELREIANSLGVSTSGKETMDLVYAILDQSALQTASDTAKNASQTKRRSRVKTVDRVYTANKEKAKKVDKTVKRDVDDSLFGSLSNEEKDLMTQTQEEERLQAQKEVENESKQAPTEEKPAPKKRGRKPGSKNKPKNVEPMLEGMETPTETVETKIEDNPTAAPITSAENAENKGGDSSENFLVMEFAAQDNSAQLNPQQTSLEAPTTQVAEKNDEATEVSEGKLENGQSVMNTAQDEDSDFIILQDLPPIDYAPQPQSMEYYGENEYRHNAYNTPASQQETLEVPATYPTAEPVAAQQKAKTFDFGNLLKISGVLETVDNYGFLRSSDYNYLPSPDDVYITQVQIKHYGLKTGDVVEGFVRPPKPSEKFFTMAEIVRINGCDPQVIRDRVAFEYLTPLFPDEKYNLCQGDPRDSQSCRIVDLFTPIGKGQRALIVAQPKTGKTLLMKDIANAIARNHPEAYLIMLLIDERPEEVTDMARTVNAEVIASTFDAPAENHVKIAGLVLEKAKRMVECGQDVVIFLDSITRLARAYNTVSPGSGKVLTGGVDANALQRPKRFFGAARNIEGGGSLTIIATALIDTGSKMDEVIFEEFKGTGNMELQLDRTLSNKRVFPAVNLVASSTRRDDLLQDQTTLNRMWILRKHIADMTPMEAMDLMKTYMEKTKSNEELLISMNG